MSKKVFYKRQLEIFEYFLEVYLQKFLYLMVDILAIGNRMKNILAVLLMLI
jgi:hypothetical protein